MITDTPALNPKIQLLGNGLMVLSILGIIGAFFHVSYIAPFPNLEEPAMAQSMFEQTKGNEYVTAETTVRELMEMDLKLYTDFYELNMVTLQAAWIIRTMFHVFYIVIFLCMALAWRRNEIFGKASILGLRFFGVAIFIQSLIAIAMPFFLVSFSTHNVLYLSRQFDESVGKLSSEMPAFSSAIVLMILSYALDYARKLKEEQSLVI